MISFLSLIKIQKKKKMPAKLKDELSDAETYCIVTWSALKRTSFSSIFQLQKQKSKQKNREIIDVFFWPGS